MASFEQIDSLERVITVHQYLPPNSTDSLVKSISSNCGSYELD